MFTNNWWPAGGKGGYPRSEKWKNLKNCTHSKIKFYIIFIQFFFSTMDIKIFTYGEARGAGMGWAEGVIRSEKWENHKNSTNSKMNFYLIFITIFFSTIYIKNLPRMGRSKIQTSKSAFSFVGGRSGAGFNIYIYFFAYYYIISSM